MTCYRPLPATRLVGGGILIHKRSNYKKTPAHLGEDLELPCGKCIGCRADHGKAWATRCLHESELHQHNCALTLTYANDTNYSQLRLQDWVRPHQDMWTTQKSAREFSTAAPKGNANAPNIATVDNSRSNIQEQEELSKNDHQKFLKRLRDKIKTPIRFYMCGEYGDKLGRPHYHYLIFGYDFPDKTYFKKSLSGTKLYRSPLLEEVWTAGHAWIGELDYSTCAYVANYVLKKQTGELALEKYRRTDIAGNDYWITPEFNYMSRRPGIGYHWWNKFHNDVTSQDTVFRNSSKTKPPRYYDKLLERQNPALHAEIKAQRLTKAANKEKDTPARLQAKETVHKARNNLKTRQLED